MMDRRNDNIYLYTFLGRSQSVLNNVKRTDIKNNDQSESVSNFEQNITRIHKMKGNT